MREGVTAYIGLGANLGDAASAVQGAMEALGQLPRTALQRQSSLYLSTPVEAGGPDYVNAVAEISTRLDAHELLEHLQAIESAAGRQRPHRNAPRTLDLDLLLYGDERIHTDTLQVPHPRMQARAFVLVPLAEIAPQRVPAQALAAVAHQRVDRVPAMTRSG